KTVIVHLWTYRTSMMVPDVQSIEWKDGRVRFLDQTLLPAEERVVETDDPAVLARAIKSLAIRGAPLIGIAAAYGVALAFQHHTGPVNPQLTRVYDLFASTRPTAVNLFWALDRMKKTALLQSNSSHGPGKALLETALSIHEDDRHRCREIGRRGAAILSLGCTILTHCNTGALATGGIGTALGVIRTAWELGILKHVYMGETRPLLQGGRLTAWELKKLGIPSTLITDSTAAFLMLQGRISAVVVGADRIAANGDTANKIGTYGIAVAARHHGLPFYVAAPTSTVDVATARGKDIPIELRSPAEIVRQGERAVAPSGTEVYAPAFDVTPGDLITGIITEHGVVHSPYAETLGAIVHAGKAAAS
ncbi:MAG TPA: S-methyl-5-thioribose-1-phosphate isomerase, partial [Bacteroidota bacterium]